MYYIKNFDLFGIPVTQVPCVKIDEPPTSETAGVTGLLAICTAGYCKGEIYKCVDSSNSIYTWENITTQQTSHTGTNIKGDYNGYSITAVTPQLNNSSNDGIYMLTLSGIDGLSIDDDILISGKSDTCYIVTIENIISSTNMIKVTIPGVKDFALRTEDNSTTIKADSGFKIYNFIVKLSDPTIGNKRVSFNTLTAGDNTMAIKRGAVAFGENTIAYGSNSFAGGKGSKAADVGFAWGLETEAAAAGSVSLGQGNVADGVCSLAVGQVNASHAQNSVTFGYQNTGGAKNSLTIGNQNINESPNSLMIGDNLKPADESNDYEIDNIFVAGVNEAAMKIKNDNTIELIGDTKFSNSIISTSAKINGNIDAYTITTGAISGRTGLLQINKAYASDIYTNYNCDRKLSSYLEWNFTAEDGTGKTYDLGNSKSYNVTRGKVITRLDNTWDNCILPDYTSDKTHTNDEDKIIGITTITPTTGKSDYLHIHLPKGLKFIGKGVFYYGSFPTIDMPKGLEMIGSDAFAYNRVLKEIELPASLTYIADNAFNDCTNVKFLVEKDTYAEQWCIDNNKEYFYTRMSPDMISFDDLINKQKYYDDISVEISDPDDFDYAYKDSDIKIIGYHGDDKTVVIPYSINGHAVTDIGAGGTIDVNRWNNAEIIIVPNNIKELGMYAFSFTPHLKKVIANKITRICNGAFEGCTGTEESPGLEEVIIPDSVEIIENFAFGYCDDLKKVSIGPNVSDIGMSSFVKVENDKHVFNKNITFYVEEGSYADTYCQENGATIMYTATKSKSSSSVLYTTDRYSAGQQVDLSPGSIIIEQDTAESLGGE